MPEPTAEELEMRELPPQRFTVERWYRNEERIRRLTKTLERRANPITRPNGREVAPALTAGERASMERELTLRLERQQNWKRKAQVSNTRIEQDGPPQNRHEARLRAALASA